MDESEIVLHEISDDSGISSQSPLYQVELPDESINLPEVFLEFDDLENLFEYAGRIEKIFFSREYIHVSQK